MPDEERPLTVEEVDVAERILIGAGYTQEYFDLRVIADWRRMRGDLEKISEPKYGTMKDWCDDCRSDLAKEPHTGDCPRGIACRALGKPDRR